MGERGQKRTSAEAAEILGVSKRSQDDCLYLVQKGKKYGFDFKSNFKTEIRVLLNFIKAKQALKKRKSVKLLLTERQNRAEVTHKDNIRSTLTRPTTQAKAKNAPANSCYNRLH